MKAALEKYGFKGCKDSDLEPVFTYLEFCLKQVGRHLVARSSFQSHPRYREAALDVDVDLPCLIHLHFGTNATREMGQSTAR